MICKQEKTFDMKDGLNSGVQGSGRRKKEKKMFLVAEGGAHNYFSLGGSFFFLVLLFLSILLLRVSGISYRAISTVTCAQQKATSGVRGGVGEVVRGWGRPGSSG